MKVVGYAQISSNTTTGMSAIPMERFNGKICRVFEFASDGGVLVIDSQCTGIATFDKEDVLRKFECTSQGDVLMPKDLNEMEQILYMGKVMMRKGGYNELLKNMVIASSLSKGEFYDDFLFQNQD